MRSILYLVVAGAALLWLAKSVLLGPQVMSAAVVPSGEQLQQPTLTLKHAEAAAMEGATVSPLELMRKHGKDLRTEQWDAF
jgi:hypothetical protein